MGAVDLQSIDNILAVLVKNQDENNLWHKYKVFHCHIHSLQIPSSGSVQKPLHICKIYQDCTSCNHVHVLAKYYSIIVNTSKEGGDKWNPKQVSG